MRKNPVHSPIAEFTPELTAVLLEYSTLSARQRLSESQANRMREILEMANDNPSLDFWITEIDYHTGHRLGFLDETHLEHYKEQQPMIQKYLETLGERVAPDHRQATGTSVHPDSFTARSA